MRKVILASQSPRRKMLLSDICSSFTVAPSTADEKPIVGSPSSIVQDLALQKARNVEQRYPKDIIISADTIVVLNGDILGKPKGVDGAYEMLSRLSGQTHEVYTGVCISMEGDEMEFYDLSKVTFFDLSLEQIKQYIATGSPFDKAGGYGIQDSGFVAEIVGSFTNVMGLPTEKLKVYLNKFLEEHNEQI